MKVRLIQKDILSTDLSAYLDAAEADGVDLVCFGELATSGCLYAPRDLPTLDDIIAGFGSRKVRIMTGVAYQAAEGRRNGYVYLHGDATQVYHKVNLFPGMNEEAIFVPGEDPGIWETDFGSVGVAICYDIRFPAYFDALKQAGVQLIVIPAAFPRERIVAWRSLLIERALQTRTRVIGVNAVGNDGTNVFGGVTMVVDPDGTVVAEADQESEIALTFEM